MTDTKIMRTVASVIQSPHGEYRITLSPCGHTVTMDGKRYRADGEKYQAGNEVGCWQCEADTRKGLASSEFVGRAGSILLYRVTLLGEEYGLVIQERVNSRLGSTYYWGVEASQSTNTTPSLDEAVSDAMGRIERSPDYFKDIARR